MGEPLSIKVVFELKEKKFSPVLGVVFKTQLGTPLFTISNRIVPGYAFEIHQGKGAITCHFPSLPLMPGDYVLDLCFVDQIQDYDVVLEAVWFSVEAADIFGSGKLPPKVCGPFIMQGASWDLSAET